MENNSTQNNDSLSGYLHIRSDGKVKSSKKNHWFLLDENSNELLSFKNSKDADNKNPIESLQLFGAGISYGNTDDHEFIINIRGSEYRLNADSHKAMMKWYNTLQKQVKIKPKNASPSQSTTTKLQSVPENDPLEISRDDTLDNHHRRKPSKKRNFIQRIFSRKGRSGSKKTFTSNESMKNGERVVKAAPLRSVVGSMQDISTKPTSCNNCNLLQGHQTYLTTQVQQLNEDVENVKEQLRSYVRKFAILERSQIMVKKDYVLFIQNSFTQDENSYDHLLKIPGSKNLIEILNQERETDRTLPVLDSNHKLELHEDHLGFIHGSRDTPMEVLLYICDVLKIKYSSILQDSDDIHQQWQTYAAGIVSEPSLTIDSNLEELVTHGIPHELRATLWKLLVTHRVSNVVAEKGSGYYKSLIDKLPDLQGDEDENDGSIEKQVKIDLMRTMPTHKDFQDLNSGKIPIMHRILRAYLLHNPDIGYCQGMNFMVGFALLYLDEETSFWLLVSVTEIFFSKNHYNLYLSGTQANQKVLDEICRQEFPALIKHLDGLMCELAPITFNWFMTIFIDSLPVETGILFVVRGKRVSHVTKNFLKHLFCDYMYSERKIKPKEDILLVEMDVPQVVLCVWDIFLVFGHPILYKVALSLVKIYQSSIRKGKDALAVMRKLKKLGRSFHDTDALLKEVFSNSFQQTPEYYLDLYKKYLAEIEEESHKRKLEDEEYEKKKQKIKFTPKQMMVSISENLDELDDDLIIKCAQCEANRNYVWLLCTSDLMAQIYIFNVASRKLDPINWQVDSKCLSMASLPNANIMLVSTIKSSLHAIDVETKHELWKMQLAGSALDISCDTLGNVALALMDGTVAFLNIKSKDFHQSYPTYVDISRSPVFCGCINDEIFWCGAANKIVVIDIKTLETSASLRVCPNERHTVSQLVPSEHGVWSSIQGSSVLHLWDVKKFVCLLTVDILDECGLSSEKKKGDVYATSITTILSLKDKIWVGFGNGRFIICDVMVNASSEDDLNDAFNLFKSMENLSVSNEETVMKKSPSKLGVAQCSHQITGEDNTMKAGDSPVHQYVDDSTDFVMVDKRLSTLEDGGHSVMLKMNQIQRVCENQVNYFVTCRQDGKLVLSCMGALNDDSSVILWSSERREGREMWFAQTVSKNE